MGLAERFHRAVLQYDLYSKYIKAFKMPVYNSIGNHEIFGWYSESGVNKDHIEYGKKMFLKRLGQRYYSFSHREWHFIILDSVGVTEEGTYRGFVDREQIDWLKKELQMVSRNTPIAISVHIPFISARMQLEKGSLEPNSERGVITNSKDVLDLFKDHNLKLVLQGHLHILEYIFIKGIHFFTGGAVSGAWWEGPHEGIEEGFLFFRVDGESFKWDYINYGWDAEVYPLTDHPQVLIETEAGNIKAEIYLDKAPVTASNFLRYVDSSQYHGLNFFRTVTLANQPKNKVKIEVIQAKWLPGEKEYPPISHESTDETGVLHLDGTISMARDKPGTAASSFFICVGRQKELDFGGRRNPDGQGFSAFGRVIDGMDVVRKIHSSPSVNQILTPTIKIMRVIRLSRGKRD